MRILTFAAAACVTGAASGASAATYVITSAGAYHLGQVQITGEIPGYGSFDRNEFAGPLVLQGHDARNNPITFTTFCFDLLHPIGVGFGYQAPVNYTFSIAPLATDEIGGPGVGNPLSASQIERMSGLARLGASLFARNATDLAAQMPAVQAAIWSVEYGVAASNFSNPGSAAYYNAYLARSFPGARVPTLVARDAQGQIIGYTQGLIAASVPEPANWALLIAGFTMVGFAARRRRRIAA